MTNVTHIQKYQFSICSNQDHTKATKRGILYKYAEYLVHEGPGGKIWLFMSVEETKCSRISLVVDMH